MDDSPGACGPDTVPHAPPGTDWSAGPARRDGPPDVPATAPDGPYRTPV